VGGFGAGGVFDVVVVVVVGVVVLVVVVVEEPEAPLVEPLDEPVDEVPVGVVAVFELAGAACCLNGSRARPFSFECVGALSTLTIGIPGVLVDGSGGSGGTGVLAAVVDRNAGMPISATSSAAAIGHSRFSRRSLSASRRIVITITG
ncbi:MAG TPA: hypothetical protein VGX45_05890, partial [Solirubrobacteraceae bacterium]|nr:hypothetical protein [Solirubrobacteraceae bacterium]